MRCINLPSKTRSAGRAVATGLFPQQVGLEQPWVVDGFFLFGQSTSCPSRATRVTGKGFVFPKLHQTAKNFSNSEVFILSFPVPGKRDVAAE